MESLIFALKAVLPIIITVAIGYILKKIKFMDGDFAKKANKLEIKAGVVEGTVYDAQGMAAIASIPSREVLIGRLLGSMQSPIANFARVINQIAEKNGGAAEA